MAKEKKIAHDYFLDCCKKYGVEIVSDKQVRSHFKTIVRFEGKEHTVEHLSIYGSVGDKASGMMSFKNMMVDHYRDINKEEAMKWSSLEMFKKDILYTPKAKESDLMEIFKLLNKVLTIADKGENIPVDVFNEVSNAVGITHRYLIGRGEL